jgi:hypothetical protein
MVLRGKVDSEESLAQKNRVFMSDIEMYKVKIS